jgi:hypothetical protein
MKAYGILLSLESRYHRWATRTTTDEAAQIRHFNSQATSILLGFLCREEYNKVQGLKNSKEIWDILKTAHVGDKVTKITKRETIKGELGRFVLNKEKSRKRCTIGSRPW